MRIFLPLRSAPVALLWAGLSLSAIGDQLYAVALTWIAVAVFGTAAGYLAALQSLALLVAALGTSGWADRRDQAAAMIQADLLRGAVLLAVVACWLITGAPAALPLIAAIVLLALGQAVFQPALQAVLPPLVSDIRLLPAANALLDATDRSARLLGPGLVALLAGLIPQVHFLTLDALSFLVSAGALLTIRRLRPRSPTFRLTGREGVWRGLRRGVRAMLGHKLLGYVLATSGLSNGLWYGVFYLGLPLMIEHLGVTGPGGSGLGAFGLVISAYGSTNLLATIVFGGRPLAPRPQYQMFIGSVVGGVGIVLLGLASLLPQAWLLPGLAASASVSAIGGPMKDIPVAVLRQSRLPAADIPAAVRAQMVVGGSGVLSAMLLAPLAYAHFGMAPVVAGCGAVMVGTGLAGLARHARWIEPVT